MLGGASPNPGGNNVTVNVKDLVCECPPNPTLTCLDFSHQYGNRLSNVLIHDGVAADIHPVEPTHDNSYGVKLPPTNHSSRVDCDGLNVTGFRQGVLIGELTSGRIICQACYVGIEVPFAYHPSKLEILGTYGCNYGISCTSAQSVPLRIDLFSIQDDNSQYTPWQIVIKDIYDPVNFLRGTFTWSKIQASVGVMHTLTKNGAANFIGTELW